MENTSQNQPTIRNFNSVSPSAYSLLLLKGYTDIPYARKAAELVMQPEKYEPDYSITDFTFWGRVVHFENRYKSIDQLMADIPAKNILELSSGFSFRGLTKVQVAGIHYIDTDLPDLIEDKKRFIAELNAGHINETSKLETVPLNVLEEDKFIDLVNHFPAGESIVIVNEGLLMYLNLEEKERLLNIIHKILSERGGYWITADIYIKRGPLVPNLPQNDHLARFFEQHKIRDQMFDSFEAAEAFFNKAGFIVDKQAEPDYSQLSSIGYFLNNVTEEQREQGRKAGRIQATWRLRVANT